MTEPISIAISTCPNDTFAFHGLLERKVDPEGFEFRFTLGDVEELNRRFARGELQVAKASFHAALRSQREAVVLPVGAALGFGVGPILLARRGAPQGPNGALEGRVLVPGEHTTAALLIDLFHRGEGNVQSRVFSEIMPALERGDADYGACIHEGRFTWRGRGLELVEDLGARWERETHAPLPLGGILAQKELGRERIERLTLAIRASIEYGFAHREEALATMRRHALELDDDVLWKHVELYVNADTLELSSSGRRALELLGTKARELGRARELDVHRTDSIRRLFRIATLADRAQLADGRDAEFGARSLAPDGFVHLSFAEQIGGTLARHFSGERELALFEIDRRSARGALRFESSRDGELFPHLHRALERRDVLGEWRLARGANEFELPALAPAAALDRPGRCAPAHP